ncbi:RNA polymerase sigma factor [Haloferula sp. BvORR071]|uniref:RNA polymerase sigma factor n=1 Tax=Haloferula sp. BvORR071 TaxID=1396141 RepID=UPI0005569C4B|nr:RNA polymerase sigma factor [Haloferula sp. BvORR071]
MMQDSGRSDPELLAEWLASGSEPAFHALVERYAGLVLMTAKRICGDDSMAAEASQLTFILLARKAKSLTACDSLGGWIHRATRMNCQNLLRSHRREDRKRLHLKVAMEPSVPPVAAAEPAGIWAEMQPVLDEALAALSDRDREALLLRFYRSLSIREIAQTLGIAVDAAQKRLDRASGRLRGQLAQRGCQAGGTLAAAMLLGFAADVKAAAPAVSLMTSKALAAAALGGGAVATTVASTSVLTTAAMKTTTVLVPAIAAVLATTWIAIQHHSIVGLEEQKTRLEKQVSVYSASAASPGAASARSRPSPSNSGAAARNAEEDWQNLPPGPQRTAAVEARSKEILFEKNPSKRLRLFSRFISHFETDDFEAIAASFAGHDQEGRLFPREYDLFLSTAAMLGGEAAMNKIYPPGDQLNRPPFDAQHSAMMAWAVEDPQAAAEWWNRLPESVVKTELSRSLIGGIASADIGYAWECLHQFPEGQRAGFMATLVQQQVADQGAEAAAQWMDGLQAPAGSSSDLGALKQQGFGTLMGTLVNLTPEKKSAFIDRFIDEPWMQQSGFPASMAGEWATWNGDEAVAWADHLPEGPRMSGILTALSVWHGKKPEEYEAWKSTHAEDPVFREPIGAFEGLLRTQAAKEQ